MSFNLVKSCVMRLQNPVNNKISLRQIRQTDPGKQTSHISMNIVLRLTNLAMYMSGCSGKSEYFLPHIECGTYHDSPDITGNQSCVIFGEQTLHICDVVMLKCVHKVCMTTTEFPESNQVYMKNIWEKQLNRIYLHNICLHILNKPTHTISTVKQKYHMSGIPDCECLMKYLDNFVGQFMCTYIKLLSIINQRQVIIDLYIPSVIPPPPLFNLAAD